MDNYHNNLTPEGDFVGAEPHLLAAGTRDSARLLAQVYYDWAKASNFLQSHAGTFALRAVLPYVAHSRTPLSRLINRRYLLNGNILAARTFLGAFISYVSPSGGTVLPIGNTGDEITFSRDSLLNFAQLAVRSVQRAAGAQNRTAREAWIRLCGTYQSRAALLAQPEIRMVCEIYTSIHSTGIDTEYCRFWTNWERCILTFPSRAQRTPIHLVT
jgi:hypothetical protein